MLKTHFTADKTIQLVKEKIPVRQPRSYKKFVFTLVLVFAVLVFLSYFTDSDVIYASKSVINSTILAIPFTKSNSAFSENSGPRDFKIYDDNEEPDGIDTSPAESNPLSGSGLANSGKSAVWKGPKLVVIDPGHGGEDPGAACGKVLEKDISLDVSLRLNTLLEQAHIPTYMTRTEDSTVDLKERIYTANRKGAALFVSIHSNWFSDSYYNGTMTLYYPSSKLCAGSLNELSYASNLQASLTKALGTKNMGIIDRPNLAVLRHAEMPSVIVELGFLSNKSDAGLLSSDDFRQKAAQALADGIKKSLTEISNK